MLYILKSYKIFALMVLLCIVILLRLYLTASQVTVKGLLKREKCAQFILAKIL